MKKLTIYILFGLLISNVCFADEQSVLTVDSKDLTKVSYTVPPKTPIVNTTLDNLIARVNNLKALKTKSAADFDAKIAVEQERVDAAVLGGAKKKSEIV